MSESKKSEKFYCDRIRESESRNRMREIIEKALPWAESCFKGIWLVYLFIQFALAGGKCVIWGAADFPVGNPLSI